MHTKRHAGSLGTRVRALGARAGVRLALTGGSLGSAHLHRRNGFNPLTRTLNASLLKGQT